MGFKDEIPVFLETNLGTRIAFPVSYDITAGNFKSEVERAHIDIYPELGFPTIHAVMVKQNSNLYCIPDSLCLKHACQGIGKFWFLHADVSLKTKLEKTFLARSIFLRRASNLDFKKRKQIGRKFTGKRIRRCLLRPWHLRTVLQGLVATKFLLRKNIGKRARHKVKKVPLESFAKNLDLESCCTQGFKETEINQQAMPYLAQKLDSDTTAETPCESIPGTMSVSGIIDRYFTHLIDMDQVVSALSSEVAWRSAQDQSQERSICSCQPHGRKQFLVQKTYQTLLPSPEPDGSDSVASVRKYKRSEVGKRLVTASSSLGLSQNSQPYSLSKSKRFCDSDADTIVRNLVFEW